MSTTSFWREVGLGLLLSAIGAIVFAASSPLLGTATSLHAVLLLLSASYLALLLHGLNARAGRLLCAATWLGMAVLLVVFAPPLWMWIALCLGLVWLLRSLYRYPRLVGAALDALLTAFALAAAVATAQHSHSLFLSLWSLFLLQALFVFIPAAAHSVQASGDGAFDRAFANAEAALRRLAVRG
jgi:hypothetical protein